MLNDRKRVSRSTINVTAAGYCGLWPEVSASILIIPRTSIKNVLSATLVFLLPFSRETVFYGAVGLDLDKLRILCVSLCCRCIQTYNTVEFMVAFKVRFEGRTQGGRRPLREEQVQSGSVRWTSEQSRYSGHSECHVSAFACFPCVNRRFSRRIYSVS